MKAIFQENFAKCDKCMYTQMKSALFKPSDLIPILLFLHTFNAVDDLNKIREEVTRLLLQHWISEPTEDALASDLCSTESFDP